MIKLKKMLIWVNFDKMSVHSLVDSRLTLADLMDIDDPLDDVTNPLNDVMHQVDKMHDDDLNKYDNDSIDESMVF